MSQPARIRCQVHFGAFTADLRTGELWKFGIRIKLQDRPFYILSMLLEHPGEVVTREEMRARLWPDGTFVDFDNNISSAIGKLRIALGDSAAAPRYIETVGRGYRFAAEVTLVSAALKPLPDAPVDTPELPAEPDITTSPAVLQLFRRSWILVAAVACLVAVAAWAAYSRWSRFRASSQTASGRVMLAVLPFANLTGDESQDYFSDGMTEEMITQLGRLDAQRLGVIARTSVMRYKNTRVPLGQIGAELGVQYVLEGSLRRDAGKVRITAQLIQVRDQTHLWAREYDRELKDVLVVQADIAQEIGDEIRLALGAAKTKAAAAQPSLSPQNYEAYDLYLKGQYFLSKRTVPDFLKAIDYFQQATARDSNNPRAYAGLAACYALLGGYSAFPQKDYMAKARAAALRALEMDEQLPDAHTALALIVQNYDWDWQAAEKEFRRALELNPNYATGHHWYAEHLMWRGRFDEALQESEKARQLDPLSLIIAADRGVILFYSRQYDRAIDQFRSVFDMAPGFGRAHMITYVYVEKGMFPQALADIARQQPAMEGPWYWEELAFAQGRAGHTAEARHALEQLQRLSRRRQIDPAVFARAYLGMGDNEQALAWLQRAYAQHSNVMTTLKVDPAYDALHSDPRFRDLLQRIGLAQ